MNSTSDRYTSRLIGTTTDLDVRAYTIYIVLIRYDIHTIIV